MTAEPEASALTTPPSLTVATRESDELHWILPATSAMAWPASSNAAMCSCAVSFGYIVLVAGVTRSEATSRWCTDTEAVPVRLPAVAVRIASPCPTIETVPSGSTTATLVLDDDHVTVIPDAPAPPLVVAENWMASPTTVFTAFGWMERLPGRT